MIMLLKKKISFTPFKFNSNLTLLHILHKFSSLASSAQKPPPKSNFITDYLITSCGFSPQKASTASKRIAHIISPSRPDSVRHFFKHHGFTDSSIRSIISSYPFILSSDVTKTLEPNLRSLREMGFSELELPKLVTRNPRALVLRSVIPRIDFWKNLLNNDMKKLALALTRNLELLTQDIDKGVAAKVALLKEHGLSMVQIGMLVSGRPGFILKSVASMEALLKRAREFGFQPGSTMYVHGLSCISALGSDTLKYKMQFYRSFGWSEGQLNIAVQKYPALLTLSKENIRMKMEFLVGTAGCTQSYIAFHPILLGMSLEKKLVPRYQVMKILESNELVQRDFRLITIMTYPEKTFLEKIVVPYKEAAPKLQEIYYTACKGQIPL